ncbi:MAG: hypothetical protein JHC41_03015 [Nitrosopumilus sp.]|jgi:hypothetical protein|nr:hypothetical protein [Nitrosopumilus sp.]
MPLEDYEIGILLKMYDEQIIGMRGYTSLERVRSKIQWPNIAKAYKIKKSFDSVTRKLVKRKLLSDDGKSMAVLYLDKLGVDFVVEYLDENPNAMNDLVEKMTE